MATIKKLLAEYIFWFIAMMGIIIIGNLVSALATGRHFLFIDAALLYCKMGLVIALCCTGCSLPIQFIIKSRFSGFKKFKNFSVEYILWLIAMTVVKTSSIFISAYIYHMATGWAFNIIKHSIAGMFGNALFATLLSKLIQYILKKMGRTNAQTHIA